MCLQNNSFFSKRFLQYIACLHLPSLPMAKTKSRSYKHRHLQVVCKLCTNSHDVTPLCALCYILGKTDRQTSMKPAYIVSCMQLICVRIRIRYERISLWWQNSSKRVTGCKFCFHYLQICDNPSYGTESKADSAKISSDNWPNGAYKFRTIRFFFGQWPKGRP